jgi:phage/plasmid primase-like uncharacterized protein
MSRPGIAAVRGAAQGRWLEILPALAPALGPAVDRLGHHVSCPVHGGKDGFRLFEDAAATGGGVCNTCGGHADGFALLAWITGRPFSEVLHLVADFLGIWGADGRPRRPTPARPPAASTDRAEERTPRRDLAQLVERVWEGATHVPSRLARYLRGRGLAATQVPKTLRWHPELGYFDEDLHPRGAYQAVVALVQSLAGDRVGVHRIYLDPIGTRKAAVDPAKKLLAIAKGATRGAAVRLGEPGDTLAITEGIETGLAVMEATGLPVWAAIAAGNLERVEVPAAVRRVELWADHDANGCGQRAAETAAARFHAEGREVVVLLPPDVGQDWLDVLTTQGPDAVRAARVGATPWQPPRVSDAEPEPSAALAGSDGAPPTAPDGGKYGVHEGCLSVLKRGDDGRSTPEPLCNFDAWIEEDRQLDNGQETTHAFLIRGRLATGDALAPIAVPADRFRSIGWVTSQWGARPIIKSGPSRLDQIREAIQRRSCPVQRVVFTHTGWRQLEGGWCYLSGEGAIGAPGVQVDLGPELRRYRLPLKPVDLKLAMRESLKLLQLAPLMVTVPLWCAMFRAPLAEILPVDFTVWVAGRSGVQKSSLAAVFMAHHGDFPDRTALNLGWSSSENYLEQITFTLKDTVAPVDDFVASPEQRDLQNKAARLVRAQGNLAGRGRMTADTGLRPSRAPRGLLLVTGEAYPQGESVFARTFTIDMEAGMVRLEALTAAQRPESLWRLPHAMAGYLAWLAPQMRNGLAAEARTFFLETRSGLQGNGTHLRVPEIIAQLAAGQHFALRFAVEAGALSDAEATAREAEGLDALRRVGQQQGAQVAERRPTRIFLEMLQGLLVERRFQLLRTHQPTEEAKALPVPLGWADNAHLYLIPRVAVGEVTRACREQGVLLAVDEARLIRELVEDGIADGETERAHRTRTARVGGKVRRVLRLNRAAIERVIEGPFALPEDDLRESGDEASGAALADDREVF